MERRAAAPAVRCYANHGDIQQQRLRSRCYDRCIGVIGNCLLLMARTSSSLGTDAPFAINRGNRPGHVLNGCCLEVNGGQHG